LRPTCTESGGHHTNRMHQWLCKPHGTHWDKERTM
jgi:hypothetical protein